MYFSKILGGNIPLNIVSFINSNKRNYNLNQELAHYQLREGMEDVFMSADINELLISKYGGIIKKSLELNKDKVLLGLYNLIQVCLKTALNDNYDNVKNIINSSHTEIQSTINKFRIAFGNEFLAHMKSIQLNENLFDLHIMLTHLSGVTNQSIENIDLIEKQIVLNLELGKNIKVLNIIDTYKTFMDILSPSNILQSGKYINFHSLFNSVFINKFALTILNIWENILFDIMEDIKYEKIIFLYIFGVEFSDGLYNLKNIKSQVIENFGITAGNKTNIKDTTTIKTLKEIEKNIDQSRVIKGMTSLLSSAITNAVSKNSADLLRSIAASNKISVSGAKAKSLNITNVNQTNTITQETNANFVQQTTSKVINDISNKLSENITTTVKQIKEDIKKKNENEKESTSAGGMLDTLASVANNALDTVGEIMSISAGNSTNKDTSKDISDDVKEKLNLNQSFKAEKNDSVQTQLQNILSSENLSKCAADTKASNELEFSNIDIDGPINFDNIKQENIVNDVMKCAFDQSIMNEIANKIINDYSKLISDMIDNVDSNLDDSTKEKVIGDIYALGTAAGVMLESAGEAVSTAAEGTGKGIESAGQGVSVAAEGVGTGVSTAAQGVGAGISSALSGMVLPLIAGAVVLVLLLIGYYFYKTSMNKENNDDDDESN